MTAQVRALQKEEQARLLQWAADEGWNPGLSDADLFWNLDPDGFLGIEVDGQMAGGGAIIRHNDSFGFMGLFIVHPDFRGQHLGRDLWMARRDQLLSRLASGATIGLDGVDEMVSFYERGGFRAFTRHRRFELAPSATSTNPDSRIVDLRSVKFDDVVSLDRQCFPGERDGYLRPWIKQDGAVSLGLVDDQGLQGFGVMRRCRTGWKVGPMFAESYDTANHLFCAFQSQANDDTVYLDAPDNNADAMRLCRSHEMNEVFGCTRMYLGPVPDLRHNKIYGITTLEVG